MGQGEWSEGVTIIPTTHSHDTSIIHTPSPIRTIIISLPGKNAAIHSLAGQSFGFDPGAWVGGSHSGTPTSTIHHSLIHVRISIHVYSMPYAI